MDKGKLHHLWRKLRPISYWYFLVGCVVCGLVAIYALRQNNLTAVRLRDEVLKVDQQNGDVEAALRTLRAHVYGHMNASLANPTGVYPPIQLKYRYERLVTAEKERVSAQNERIYNDAQTTCEQQFPAGLSGGGRVPCIEAYVANHGVKEQPIPDALYKFDFVAPVWSPDLAGWSLVLAGLFLALFAFRLSLEIWLKRSLSP